LIESKKKHILLAPAIYEEAQREAAHDSGASSCLIGFKEKFHNYKQQQIPICTAEDTIYAAGLGSVGLFQNVIYVPGIQTQLLSISQIFNQLNFFYLIDGYYLIDGNKCEVLNSNNEIIHTCFRNNGLYTTRDLSWIGIDLSNATNDIGLKRAQAEQIHAYVAGIAKNALIIQSELLQQSQPNPVTLEDLTLIRYSRRT
jgi:hypothetical protein